MVNIADFEVKQIKDLQVGDIVLQENGEETEIIEVFDEHIPETMFEITTKTGVSEKFSGNHYFYVETDLLRSTFRKHKNYIKKRFKDLPKQKQDEIEEWAQYEKPYYIIGADVYDMLNVDSSIKPDYHVERIIHAVGHEELEKLFYERQTVASEIYSRKRIAKQILGLVGKKPYKHDVLKGKVIDTVTLHEILNSPEHKKVWIPA